jgi:hypothetical protein
MEFVMPGRSEGVAGIERISGQTAQCARMARARPSRLTTTPPPATSDAHAPATQLCLQSRSCSGVAR